MIVLTSYANALYRKGQKLNNRSGKKVGLFDRVIPYSPKDIEPAFYEKTKRF